MFMRYTGRIPTEMRTVCSIPYLRGSQNYLYRCCQLGWQRRCHSQWRKDFLPRGDGKNQSAGLNIPFEDHYKIRSHIELLIQDYANKPIPPITYDYLTQYKPPLRNNEEYLLSIQTVNLLLCYTCRQLQAIQNLPYIVVINPNIELTNSLYLSTLETLLSIEYPYGLHNRNTVVKLLTNFLEEHQDTLTTLATGFQEVMRFYDQEHVFNFLNLHLRNRISMKMLATHYLSLLDQSTEKNSGNCIGVLNKDLKVSSLVEHVAEFVNDLCSISYDRVVPIKIVEGQDVAFTCIPTSLEYVLTEVLKNSCRAHIERSTMGNRLLEKPVEVTIVRNDNELQIRVRDFGGGIPPNVEKRMFDYSYSTVAEKKNDTGAEAYILPGESVNNVSGMGFGLPMCKAYMEMFNGRLDIQSLWGWGTDVYLKLTGPTKEMLNR
ncbi:related to [Pyruvate dehydrogenase [lipoamide]] kinase, mitochondrial [Zygosaccharomyces bailii]|nr:related to [Pyruvate dehydrogenase [lipoamide]] kinase, mitochondrial [Zygosaccharomyces bailii]